LLIKLMKLIRCRKLKPEKKLQSDIKNEDSKHRYLP